MADLNSVGTGLAAALFAASSVPKALISCHMMHYTFIAAEGDAAPASSAQGAHCCLDCTQHWVSMRVLTAWPQVPRSQRCFFHDVNLSMLLLLLLCHSSSSSSSNRAQ